MDHDDYTNDPGLRLTPLGRRVLLVLLLIGLLVAVVLVFSDPAGAAPLEGNRGGCNPASRAYGLTCTVQNAGLGWVSGTCVYGEYFLAQTARTFRPGQVVHVTGCEDQYGVLFSAPGFPLRISR